MSRIRTTGPACFGRADIDVLAFHLHRYLAHWLSQNDRSAVWVTVGFEHSFMPAVTIEVSRTASKQTDVPWTFPELAAAFHRGEDSVHLGSTESGVRRAHPLTESSSDGVPTLLGFVVVVGDGVDDRPRAELEVHVCEGLRAARRNGVRLFFDEADEQDMKTLIYRALDRLPDWTGCDVASAVVLSNSLEAMASEAAHESEFYVMAERLYVDSTDDDSAARLVGMQIDTRDDVRTVIDAAISLHQADPTSRLYRFRRNADGYLDPNGETAVSIGSVPDRPDDAVSLVAPLVVCVEEPELLGFLCLAFSGSAATPRSLETLVEELAERLGHELRFSPLYTLSARKLRLVRLIRQTCESHVADRSSADELIASVVGLVQQHTEVPAFSVGRIEHRNGERHVVYPASYGWTQFDTVSLLVDVAEDGRLDSGVSSLAIRLGRPLVLAGGRTQEDHAEFKNYLWVHEESGRICDIRGPGCGDIPQREGWVRLGQYYKPARDGAYATIAHPVTFDGEALGVVALEVDRETNWYWWTGYGGQLLWELIAFELAFALRSLGSEVSS